MAVLGGVSILLLLFCALGVVALIVILAIAIGSAAKKKNEQVKLEREIREENAGIQQNTQDPSNPYLRKHDEVQ